VALDPNVESALQAAHDLEATASEKWHKQEHQFKSGLTRYPALGKWFDRRHKEAEARKHDIRKWMISNGSEVDTNLGDTGYTDKPMEAFEAACDLLDELTDAYGAIHVAAGEADDRETCERFHGYSKHVADVYHDGEQRQRQLKDLGEPLFLSQMLHKKMGQKYKPKKK